MKKNISSVTSYRTDARHGLTKTVTVTGIVNAHRIGARGVTTVVMDMK